jgi:hypothetical protein
MRRVHRSKDILPRATARINRARLPEPLECNSVKFEPFALVVRRKWSAYVATFLPLKSQPAQVLDETTDEFGPGAARIEIFIAKDESPTEGSGSMISGPKRARVAQMEVSSGGGRKPAAIV